jgi:hypothetical protein
MWSVRGVSTVGRLFAVVMHHGSVRLSAFVLIASASDEP